MPRIERRDRESKWENPDHRGLAPSGHDLGIRKLPHFCRRGSMHICTASESGDRQKNCFFYSKATMVNHCIELRFDEFCGNHILHQYITGGMSDARAKDLIKKRKTTFLKIQNKADGYHIIFPVEGEETYDDLVDIYEQLKKLGLATAAFWVDENGISAQDQTSFRITQEDIKAGKWIPKRKELTKDILRYLELKEKLAH